MADPDRRPDAEPITVFSCGPSNRVCHCECASGGPCEHVWDGATETWDTGESATCSRCGMVKIDHDLWVLP